MDEVEFRFRVILFLFVSVFMAFQSSKDGAFHKDVQLFGIKKGTQVIAADPKAMSMCLKAAIVLAARAIIPMLEDSHCSIRALLPE